MDVTEWIGQLGPSDALTVATSLVVGFGVALLTNRSGRKQLIATFEHEKAKERRELVGASYALLDTGLGQLGEWAHEQSGPIRWERNADGTPRFLPPDPPPALPSDGRLVWSEEVRQRVERVEIMTRQVHQLSMDYSRFGPMGPVDAPNQTDDQRYARRISEQLSMMVPQLRDEVEALKKQVTAEARP